eukprot:13867874-Ditylum_brightwellii.AAC.1
MHTYCATPKKNLFKLPPYKKIFASPLLDGTKSNPIVTFVDSELPERNQGDYADFRGCCIMLKGPS